MTNEEMIKAGGKIWEKGNVKRIYLNDDTLDALFEINLTALKRIKPKKKTTYFDCKSEQFYSENGMIVRNAIRRADLPVCKL